MREIQTPMAELWLAEFRGSQFHARIMPDGSSFPITTHSDSACPEPGLSQRSATRAPAPQHCGKYATVRFRTVGPSGPK
jgi:hypothetical protein